MVDTPTIVVEQNGYRNLVIRASLISDGSGLSAYTLFDATSTTYQVNKGGQNFLVGTHVTIQSLYFDVEGMSLALYWDATTDQLLFPLGATPDTWEFQRFGGLKVPAGLTGATGSILATTTGHSAGDTFSLVMHLRKNVPAS